VRIPRDGEERFHGIVNTVTRPEDEAGAGFRDVRRFAVQPNLSGIVDGISVRIRHTTTINPYVSILTINLARRRIRPSSAGVTLSRLPDFVRCHHILWQSESTPSPPILARKRRAVLRRPTYLPCSSTTRGVAGAYRIQDTARRCPFNRIHHIEDVRQAGVLQEAPDTSPKDLLRLSTKGRRRGLAPNSPTSCH
jgi:hypothetical protein